MTFEDLGDSSVPLSPNRVQAGRSQEMPADGSQFGVSPDTPGFVMQPAGAAPQLPGAVSPMPLDFDGFSDPIAFTQCTTIPGSEAPMTLPVYTMPPHTAFMTGQSAVPTVLASGVSPRTVPWSIDRDRIDDIIREGPFDAVASPMDMEDSPLITTGLLGCPYRITSYNGPALSDMNSGVYYGLVYNSTTRGSWNSSEHQSQPDCCITHHRFAWIVWERSVPWQRQ